MLYIDNYSCGFSDNLLFDGLTIKIPASTRVCVRGPNGVGKSTLLKCLSGLMKPNSGYAYYIENDNSRRHSCAEDFMYLGHSGFCHQELSVLENIKFICSSLDIEYSQADIQKYTKSLGIYEHLNRKYKYLSKGGKRKTSLIPVFLARGKKVWALDEPLEGVDANGVAVFNEQVGSYLQDGGIVIEVRHDVIPADIRLDFDV